MLEGFFYSKRNKELIFFSNIKNILTVFILCEFLLRNFGKLGLPGTYSLELFLLVSCCAVNTISSTAYSRDPNRSYLAFLPISTHQLFLWKTIQGFIWGEITIFLFWFGTVFLHGLSVADACLLLIYGTMMNYACSWLGVFLDYKMPRSTNSTNELLHGNISKVFQYKIQFIGKQCLFPAKDCMIINPSLAAYRHNSRVRADSSG